MKKIRNYIPSIGLSSIIFLWPIQFKINDITIPLYIAINLFLFIGYGIKSKELVRFLLICTSLFTLTLFQFFFNVNLTTPLRSLVGIPLFSVVLVISIKWIEETRNNGTFFYSTFKFFLVAQFSYQIIQIIMWESGYFPFAYYSHYFLNIPRVSGFFSEPSHVAFSLSPFIFLYLFYYEEAVKQFGKYFLLILISIFIFSFSSTLIGVIIVSLLLKILTIKRKFRNIVFSIILTPILVISFLYLLNKFPQLNERFSLVYNILVNSEKLSMGQNLSVLVFMKGFQMAKEAIVHFPLGTGFLNFQFLAPYSEISHLSELLYSINSMEGSSIAFKLIGEFGFIGLFIVLATFKLIFKRIRNENSYTKLTINNHLHTILLFGLIASFIRGASYFDGVPLIGLSVLYYSFFRKNIVNHRKYLNQE